MPLQYVKIQMLLRLQVNFKLKQFSTQIVVIWKYFKLLNWKTNSISNDKNCLVCLFIIPSMKTPSWNYPLAAMRHVDFTKMDTC